MKQSLPNICWIIPDSVRSLPVDDPIGRLPFMDRFKKESVEYSRMYTAAPSTMMSFFSFFSGVNSIYTSDSYEFIKNHRTGIPMIYDFLSRLGYYLYFFSPMPHLREAHPVFLESTEDGIAKNEFHVSDSEVLRKNVKQFLTSTKLKAPFCFFYHSSYQGGLGEENHDFSEHIEEIYTLASRQLDPKNSIVLIHSDHGFPIYRNEEDKEFMWTHDLVMTEENICIPFFLRYPNCPKNSVVSTPASLVDIFPTIAQYLEPSTKDELHLGLSLIDTPNEKRIIRSDNRFKTQASAVTAIICDNRKLLYNWDKKEFSLFKIKDACEEEAISLSAPECEELRRTFLESEEIAANIKEHVKLMLIEQGKERIAQALSRLTAPPLLLAYCQPGPFFHLCSVSPSPPPYLSVITTSQRITELATERGISFQLLSTDSTSHSYQLPKDQKFSVIVLVDSITNMNPESFTCFIEIAERRSGELLVVDRWFGVDVVEDFEDYFSRKQLVFNNRKARDLRRTDEKKIAKKIYFAKLDELAKRRHQKA